MNYVARHWRGECSLPIAFWVNLFFLNLVLRSASVWLTNGTTIEHPVRIAQLGLTLEIFALVLLYPWQIVGVWKSAKKQLQHTTNRFWPRAAMAIVCFSLFGTFANIKASLPVYQDLYHTGFVADEFANFTVEALADKQLIHVRGGLGFGVSERVAQVLNDHPGVEGIILDSVGGRIYEGRELGQIIRRRGLDTYSIQGCYSACGIAFISGRHRYLAVGANLGFHQYGPGTLSRTEYEDLTIEEEQDLALFVEQGIAQPFLDKLYLANHDDMWIPTSDEMLASGVVHDYVYASDLIAVDDGEGEFGNVDELIAEVAAFESIKRYLPGEYDEIMTELRSRLDSGASIEEIHATLGLRVQYVAEQSLPTTSDQAILSFAEETIKILEMLERKDPILCLKNLFPDRFGTVVVTNHLPRDALNPLLTALDQVIVDRFESASRPVNRAEAGRVMEQVVTDLGEEISYISDRELRNNSDYSRACHATIQFYQLILAREKQAAANALRSLFAET
ncbi:MAG: hypothetical protein C9356_09335 [Oleiphilus sp.]|nr:MAG: hypothetical protein C9356_09335 [Oleiphilus sp.]